MRKISTAAAQEMEKRLTTPTCWRGDVSPTIAQKTLKRCCSIAAAPILNGLHLRRVQVLKCVKDFGCCLCCSCVP
jgi:hypothetical protein